MRTADPRWRRLPGGHRIDHRRLLARGPGAAAPGHAHAGADRGRCGQPLRERDEAAPRASGTLESHYAPRAKVRLMDGKQIQAALDVLGAGRETHRGLHPRLTTGRARGAAAPHAGRRRGLRAGAVCGAARAGRHRRQADLGRNPPEGADWDGVRDRLQRAAA
jgi:L-threonylcarbamoyladenylate synthase